MGWTYAESLWRVPVAVASGLPGGLRPTCFQGCPCLIRRRLPSVWPSYASIPGVHTGRMQATASRRNGCVSRILQRAARNKSERVERYRADIQHRLSKGVEPLLRERLADGFALGSETFREIIRQAGKGGREIAGSGRLRQRISFDTLVATI